MPRGGSRNAAAPHPASYEPPHLPAARGEGATKAADRTTQTIDIAIQVPKAPRPQGIARR
jgi:hypothetical protein